MFDQLFSRSRAADTGGVVHSDGSADMPISNCISGELGGVGMSIGLISVAPTRSEPDDTPAPASTGRFSASSFLAAIFGIGIALSFWTPKNLWVFIGGFGLRREKRKQRERKQKSIGAAAAAREAVTNGGEQVGQRNKGKARAIEVVEDDVGESSSSPKTERTPLLLEASYETTTTPKTPTSSTKAGTRDSGVDLTNAEESRATRSVEQHQLSIKHPEPVSPKSLESEIMEDEMLETIEEAEEAEPLSPISKRLPVKDTWTFAEKPSPTPSVRAESPAPQVETGSMVIIPPVAHNPDACPYEQRALPVEALSRSAVADLPVTGGEGYIESRSPIPIEKARSAASSIRAPSLSRKVSAEPAPKVETEVVAPVKAPVEEVVNAGPSAPEVAMEAPKREIEVSKVDEVIEAPKSVGIEAPKPEVPQVEAAVISKIVNFATPKTTKAVPEAEEVRAAVVEDVVVPKIEEVEAPKPKEIEILEAPKLLEVSNPFEVEVTEPKETEAPKVEAPKMEVPAVEGPIVAAPVVEAPVVEAPVVEAPKLEVPKAEIPVEAPKVETPKAQEVIEEPKEELKKAEGSEIQSTSAPTYRKSFSSSSEALPKLAEVPEPASAKLEAEPKGKDKADDDLSFIEHPTTASPDQISLNSEEKDDKEEPQPDVTSAEENTRRSRSGKPPSVAGDDKSTRSESGPSRKPSFRRMAGIGSHSRAPSVDSNKKDSLRRSLTNVFPGKKMKRENSSASSSQAKLGELTPPPTPPEPLASSDGAVAARPESRRSEKEKSSMSRAMSWNNTMDKLSSKEKREQAAKQSSDLEAAAGNDAAAAPPSSSALEVPTATTATDSTPVEPVKHSNASIRSHKDGRPPTSDGKSVNDEGRPSKLPRRPTWTFGKKKSTQNLSEAKSSSAPASSQVSLHAPSKSEETPQVPAVEAAAPLDKGKGVDTVAAPAAAEAPKAPEPAPEAPDAQPKVADAPLPPAPTEQEQKAIVDNETAAAAAAVAVEQKPVPRPQLKARVTSLMAWRKKK